MVDHDHHDDHDHERKRSTEQYSLVWRSQPLAKNRSRGAGSARLNIVMDGSQQQAPSWGRILMLSTTAFAIEFAYVLEAAYGVPAMLKSGLTEQYASGMWAAGPVLGVLFQSYLGSASDRCKCAWGRRRPFILGLALGACISLGLFPYGQLIGGSHFLHLQTNSLGIFVPVFTALTFIAMDFCLDSLQTPARAYLLDSVPVERSEKAAFLYTTMLGLGSSFGSLISAIPWERLGVGNLTDSNSHVKIVFGVSVIVAVVCVSLTLCSVKERACIPNAPESFHNSDRRSDFSDSEKVMTESNGSRKLEGEHSAADSRTAHLMNGQAAQLLIRPTAASRNPDTASISEVSHSSSCLGELHKSILDTVLFAKFMSGTFFWLWLHIFLTWISYLSMYLFLTNFVGEVVYGGLPNSEDEKVRLLYNEGVRVGCYCLLVLSITIFVYSLVSEWISECIGLRPQLLVGHLLYFIASGLAVFFPTLLTAMLVSIAAGVCFANLNSIPYALISHYMTAGILLKRAWPNESDTKGKAVSFLMMAMFVAQFILAIGLGSLIKAIGSSRVIMVVAFLGEGLAGVSAFFVKMKLGGVGSVTGTHEELPGCSEEERTLLPVLADAVQPRMSGTEGPASDHFL